MVILVVTQIGILLGGIAKILWDWQVRREDRLDREQDRLDREQLARLTLSQLASVKEAGGERLKTLVKEVIKTREVNIHAIKSANSFNDKLLKVQEKIEPSPIEVTIMNDAQHSVPTNLVDLDKSAL